MGFSLRRRVLFYHAQDRGPIVVEKRLQQRPDLRPRILISPDILLLLGRGKSGHARLAGIRVQECQKIIGMGSDMKATAGIIRQSEKRSEFLSDIGRLRHPMRDILLPWHLMKKR